MSGRAGLAALKNIGKGGARACLLQRPALNCLPACLPPVPPRPHNDAQSLSDPASVAPFARWFASRVPIMTLLILKLAMTLAILLNLLGSLWWFIAGIEGPDADSWTKNVVLSAWRGRGRGVAGAEAGAQGGVLRSVPRI